MNKCPACKVGKLTTRTSRKLDKFIERDRRCNAGCGYRDKAIVRPAEIISVVLLCTQQEAEHEATAAE